jgi:hypothetical protein
MLFAATLTPQVPSFTALLTTLRRGLGLCEIEAEVGLGGKHADAYTTRIALRTVTSHAFHRFGFSSISFCCHLKTVVCINDHCYHLSFASSQTRAVRDTDENRPGLFL